MIAIGNDHTALEMKQAVIEVLEELGLEYEDFGPNTAESYDYPISGEAAARAVADSRCNLGIVICGTGIGIGLSANKVRGIRCAMVSEPYSALMARRHNDANMIALGARLIGVETARDALNVFLATPFEGGRHAKRRDKLG